MYPPGACPHAANIVPEFTRNIRSAGKLRISPKTYYNQRVGCMKLEVESWKVPAHEGAHVQGEGGAIGIIYYYQKHSKVINN